MASTSFGGAQLVMMALVGCAPLEVPIDDRTTEPLEVLPPEVEDRLSQYLIGANLPWINYGHDFGRAWGNNGVRSPASRAQLEADFDAMLGADVVRWFVYSDGRALDTSTPEEILADLDAALEIADARGIQLMPVLFDFFWFDEASIVDGIQLFGRREIAVDPDLRRDLIDTWIVPIAERYADDERIFAFDIINEPEWALSDGLHGAVAKETVTLQQMWDFVFDVAEPLRGGRPLTVGSAKAKDLEAIWLNAPLDILQVHHYGLGGLPSVEALGTDKPVLVGEFATDGTNVRSRMETYEELGYAGALPWSLNGDDRATDRQALADYFGN
ncbi:MAG: hypothetical protein AAGA48_25755 [Myxococcota bacterium]